ncbi:inosine/xanthosine triphosphatase [candidate division WWE3 bacterium CG_4_8_14_3_um_filter_42_11]|uniref:Probable inosine/xanthosine triphosphatase n=1 Tax=candidate division WWE3 bacterium CG_4_8_14_3_um_filter_42_11 TaxID=1975076 RepID=A0A2M8G7R6_UNCKA|nr:MAG: inosine/xanthosine triphosphatase [candidate division WWE3 bacterium CG_4_8_14_3_um_filter_42_11]
MITIVVGSTNPVKIKAVRRAFEQYFKTVKVSGKETESDVSCQPKSSAESFTGALNRAKSALLLQNADFGVGIEGGIEQHKFGVFTCGWVVIVDRKDTVGVGTSARMLVPKKIWLEIKKKKTELGAVLERITGEKNIKRKGGMFGLFTKNKVTREDAYFQGVVFALAKFINTQYYQDDLKLIGQTSQV